MWLALDHAEIGTTRESKSTRLRSSPQEALEKVPTRPSILPLGPSC